MREPSTLKRLALIPLGILFGLVILEAGLRVAAFVVQKKTGAQLPVSWVTGSVRVLCLGDSNTYGIMVPREETYPNQLETLWNETVGSPKVEVLNLGFPGTNSSRLVRDFPRILETFAPDIAIVMVGVNDFWTVPFPIDRSPESRPRKGFLRRHSLIYRLYYLIRRGTQGQEIEIVRDPNSSMKGARAVARFGDEEFELGFTMADPGLRLDRTALNENLRALVSQAAEAGTTLYLMSYPARHEFYAYANPEIRRVARKTNTPLIDLTAVFQPLCPKRKCPQYILLDDHHPNARGYGVIAKTIADRIASGERGDKGD